MTKDDILNALQITPGLRTVDRLFLESLLLMPSIPPELVASCQTRLARYGQVKSAPVSSRLEPPRIVRPGESKPLDFNARYIDFEEGLFKFKFTYDDKLVSDAKNCPSASWVPSEKLWKAHTTLPACRYVEGMAARGWQLTVPAKEALKQHLAAANITLQMSGAQDTKFSLSNFGSPSYQARPFQKAGIEYALRVGNTLIGDEMGLGKTLQALGIIHNLNKWPVLYITKATLKLNVIDECLMAFGPGRKVQVLDSKSIIEDADVYAINYDILSEGWESIHKKRVVLSRVVLDLLKRRPGVMVIDESHYIKQNSQRSKAVLQIAEWVKHRFALSGTPMPNRPVELINQLKYLGTLDKFGGDWGFKQRYCDAKQIRVKGKMVWDFSGSSNLDELHKLLRSTCMIRRLADDVLDELPPMRHQALKVQLTNGPEYRKAEKDVARYATELKVQAEAFQATIRHLSPVDQAVEMRAFEKQEYRKAKFTECLLKYSALRQLASAGKMAAVKEWIGDFYEQNPNGKLIVFAHFRATQALLVEILKPFGVTTVLGSDSLQTRHANVQAFQGRLQTRAIVVSNGAGAEGITLTASQTVLTVEMPLVPGVQDQMNKRAHRIGQKGSVMAYRVIAQGTIDVDVDRMNTQKRAVSQAALDGGVIVEGEQVSTGLMSDLLEQLSQRA